MRRRYALAITLFAGLLAGLLPVLQVAQALPQQCGPYVDLTPNFGVPGQSVSVNVYNYPANTEVKVTARVAGDPVIATGTTDATGHVNIMITIPQFTGDYVNIFVYTPPCNAAGAHFFLRQPTPTPPSTPTNTATPPTTPTNTATPPTTPATTVPPTTPATTQVVITPTQVPPAPPNTGSGGLSLGTGNAGFDFALVALALVVFSSGFTLLGSSRKRAVHAGETTTDGGAGRSDEPPTPFN